jgi:hypothetical protein
VGFVVKVVAVSLESRITRDSQMHEEPSVCPASQTSRPTIGETHRGSILDASGYVSTEGHALRTAALAATVDTGCLNP